jgi:hypothetical protein
MTARMACPHRHLATPPHLTSAHGHVLLPQRSADVQPGTRPSTGHAAWGRASWGGRGHGSGSTGPDRTAACCCGVPLSSSSSGGGSTRMTSQGAARAGGCGACRHWGEVGGARKHNGHVCHRGRRQRRCHVCTLRATQQTTVATPMVLYAKASILHSEASGFHAPMRCLGTNTGGL